MVRLDEPGLVEAVRHDMTRKRAEADATGPYVLAVSGHGGAGKSTIADRIAEALAGAVVGTDEFYLAEPDRGTGLFEVHDWPTILDLLQRLRADTRLTYRYRWYTGEEGAVDEPMPPLIVIEGIRLIRPEVLAIVDGSVWLDCPAAIAGERAKERNRGQGDSQAEIDLWDTRWVPEGLAYEAAYRPAEHVDWVVRTG